MKRALVYSPYFDTMGGGERYALEVARVLSQKHAVTIAWSDTRLLEKSKARFGLSFESIDIDTKAYEVIKNGGLLNKRSLMKDYEVAFFVSDGSLPFMFARKNLLHFQVPFHEYNLSISDLLKFTQYKKVIVNSKFTQNVIRRVYKLFNTSVLYPPVTLMSPGPKTKTILNVGRFGSPTHPKKQEVLVKAFLKLPKKIRSQWRLILAGGYQGEEEFLEKLSKLSGKENILVVTNPSFGQLKKMYAQSTFYWHAAGFGQSDDNPEKMEHFGITTVEAMSAGCIPIVIAKGGQPEIVSDREGRLWETVGELVSSTMELINNPKLQPELVKASINRAKAFGQIEFAKSLIKIIDD